MNRSEHVVQRLNQQAVKAMRNNEIDEALVTYKRAAQAAMQLLVQTRATTKPTQDVVDTEEPIRVLSLAPFYKAPGRLLCKFLSVPNRTSPEAMAFCCVYNLAHTFHVSSVLIAERTQHRQHAQQLYQTAQSILTSIQAQDSFLSALLLYNSTLLLEEEEGQNRPSPPPPERSVARGVRGETNTQIRERVPERLPLSTNNNNNNTLDDMDQLKQPQRKKQRCEEQSSEQDANDETPCHNPLSPRPVSPSSQDRLTVTTTTRTTAAAPSRRESSRKRKNLDCVVQPITLEVVVVDKGSSSNKTKLRRILA